MLSPIPAKTSLQSADSPIGLLDSGLGGLSVAREIRRLLPQESLLMVADSAWAPYGDKSPEQIRERCEKISDWLIEQDCKAIVIACNTATAAAASYLRECYSLPIVGMEPAVKPAAAATKNGIVGVMATTGTLASARFAALLGKFASETKVITQPCPGLVELIEAGDIAGSRTLLENLLAPLRTASVDTLVLGCTHYPLIKAQVSDVMGSAVQIIDTGEAVARQLARRLQDGQLASNHSLPQLSLHTSGNQALAQRLAPDWLGEPVEVSRLPPQFKLNHQSATQPE